MKVKIQKRQEFSGMISFTNPTWSVYEVTVTHPRDVHPLEEQHSGGDVRLHNMRANLCRKLSIIWIQTKTFPYGTEHHTLK